MGDLRLWHHTLTSVSEVCVCFQHYLPSDANQATLCPIQPCVGEVQGRLEEDPQACFWHVRVSVHAARPEHQQTVQPGKTPQAATLSSPWNCWEGASQRPLVFTKPDWTCSRHPHLLSHCGNKQHAADYWPPLGLKELHHLKHPLFSDLIRWWQSFQPLTFWLLTFFMLAPFITLPLPSHFCLFPLVTANLFLVTT